MTATNSATRRRSFFVTLFGVVGTLWFALHGLEYIFARYEALNDMLPLPAPLGLQAFFEGLPQWASMSVTATIWIGLLGAFLLVLGDRASVLVMSLCVIAALVGLVWGGMAFFDGTGPVGGVDPLLFTAGQAAMAVAVWLYARTAKRFGTI